jgi:hypothetical protein
MPTTPENNLCRHFQQDGSIALHPHKNQDDCSQVDTITSANIPQLVADQQRLFAAACAPDLP